MTIRELIKQTQLKINDAVPEDYLIDRFNECLADLAPVLMLEGVKETELPTDIPISLPDDIYNDTIFLCRLENAGITLPRLALEDFEHTGYKIYNGIIDLQGAVELPDILRIWYQRLPSAVSIDNLDVEPEIPGPYQHALKYYAAAKWWQTELENNYENSYWRDYLDIKQQIAYYTSTKNRRYYNLTFRLPER